MSVTIGEVQVETQAPVAAAVPGAAPASSRLDPDQLRRELRRIADRQMRLWVD